MLKLLGLLKGLFYESFDDQQWNDSFDSTFNPDNVSIVSFGEALSGSYVARMYGGYLGASFNYDIVGANNTVYYIKYYQYFPSSNWNWSGISETGMKQFRVRGNDGWPLLMFKPGPLTHCYFSDGGIAGGGPGGWRGIPAFPISNIWNKIEIIVKYSDTEGGFAWYLNGQLIAGDETWSYDTWPPGSGSISQMRICGGNGMSGGSFYYIDNVEIWNGVPDGWPGPNRVSGFQIVP